jgi:hypothetical protein
MHIHPDNSTLHALCVGCIYRCMAAAMMPGKRLQNYYGDAILEIFAMQTKNYKCWRKNEDAACA